MGVGNVHFDPVHSAVVLSHSRIATASFGSVDLGIGVLQQKLNEVTSDKSAGPRDDDSFDHRTNLLEPVSSRISAAGCRTNAARSAGVSSHPTCERRTPCASESGSAWSRAPITVYDQRGLRR